MQGMKGLCQTCGCSSSSSSSSCGSGDKVSQACSCDGGKINACEKSSTSVMKKRRSSKKVSRLSKVSSKGTPAATASQKRKDALVRQKEKIAIAKQKAKLRSDIKKRLGCEADEDESDFVDLSSSESDIDGYCSDDDDESETEN